MESKKVIVRTIKRLKEIKEEQGLSVSQIMSKMAEKGYPVSESTLKRVFAPGSEKMSFRYQESIAPVAEVLFEEYGDTGATDDAAELRKIIADRDKTIENLMIKIEEQEKRDEAAPVAAEAHAAVLIAESIDRRRISIAGVDIATGRRNEHSGAHAFVFAKCHDKCFLS